MGYMIFGVVFFMYLCIAIFAAKLSEYKGLKFWNTFWVTFILGPIVGMMYIIVNLSPLRCGEECECKK